jgi:hypothetical protein
VVSKPRTNVPAAAYAILKETKLANEQYLLQIIQ